MQRNALQKAWKGIPYQGQTKECLTKPMQRYALPNVFIGILFQKKNALQKTCPMRTNIAKWPYSSLMLCKYNDWLFELMLIGSWWHFAKVSVKCPY